MNNSTQPTIVVAEDDRVTADIFRFNLSRRGLRVLVAHNGEAAWELLQQNPVSLLITDQQMPRLSGLSLCERICQHDQFTDLPIFLCSAKGLELNVEDVTGRLGVRRVFFKPFSPREVVRAVEDVLRLGAARVEA